MPNSIISRNRVGVLAGTAMLCATGIAISIGASMYVATSTLTQTYREHLASTSQQVLTHASAFLGEVEHVLVGLEDGAYAACSTQHIREMLIATIGTPGVEEIGYLDGGHRRCSGWGASTDDIARNTADFSLANGMAVTRSVTPAVDIGKNLMRLQRGKHYALVDPAAFVNVHVGRGERVTVASLEGRILQHTNDAENHLPDTLPDRRDEAAQGYVVQPLLAIRRNAILMAVSTVPPEVGLHAVFDAHAGIILLGVLVATLIVGMLILRTRRRLSPTTEIISALKREEFCVHYQPLVCLASGRCIGAEALIRWCVDGKNISPEVFVALAEEEGLIMPMTDQVVAMVIADLGPDLATRPDCHIAINVCAQDVQSGRILDVLNAALEGTGIRPGQIWLEMTERGFRDAAAAGATLARARALGYVSAIDDFGTGYSSLSCLQGLPLDVLKIDKSFVDSIDENGFGQVLEHIIALGKSLGLTLVAEGVETLFQAAMLRERGVDYGQGWLYAKAMPASEFRSFMRAAQAAT